MTKALSNKSIKKINELYILLEQEDFSKLAMKATSALKDKNLSHIPDVTFMFGLSLFKQGNMKGRTILQELFHILWDRKESIYFTAFLATLGMYLVDDEKFALYEFMDEFNHALIDKSHAYAKLALYLFGNKYSSDLYDQSNGTETVDTDDLGQYLTNLAKLSIECLCESERLFLADEILISEPLNYEMLHGINLVLSDLYEYIDDESKMIQAKQKVEEYSKLVSQ